MGYKRGKMDSPVDQQEKPAGHKVRIAWWKCVVALLLILLLGASLRFYRITELEPGIQDEATYLLEARFLSSFCAAVWDSAKLVVKEKMSGEDLWKRGEQLPGIRERTRGLPPRYGRILHDTFVAAGNLLAGERPYIGNVVNAIFGTLTILAVFFLGRTMYDDRTGLIAALIFSVMGYHIHYSRSWLAEADIAQSNIDQRLQLFGDLWNVLEQFQSLRDIHFQDIGNGLIFEFDRQRFAVVAMPLANRTGDPNVGQEIHFKFVRPVPVA